MNGQIWLASASPRRREILSWTGINFNVIPSNMNESVFQGEKPEIYVQRLAREKAFSVQHQVGSNDLIIAADTIVIFEDRILGKPANTGEAFFMLNLLKAHEHQVVTALAILIPQLNKLLADRCITPVQMRAYSSDEIQAYIDSGDPFDKAGGYAIQHSGFDPVINFKGCYASVMGMPLCHLERNLRKIEGYLKMDMAGLCQKNLEYTCPIHQQVLDGDDIG
jgi:septum formation protein